jgi:hypothetical protein
MSATIKPSVHHIDVNAQILANLDELNVAHTATKAICFAKGIPFYTCIDAVKKIFTKELSDGSKSWVTRHFDFERDVILDTVIEARR